MNQLVTVMLALALNVLGMTIFIASFTPIGGMHIMILGMAVMVLGWRII
jgi:hypothetical protein